MHWDEWIAEVEHARAAFAALIGAHPSEIAVGSSVSQLVSSVASALATSSHVTRKHIVSSTMEFPGVAHAWLTMRPRGWSVELLASDDNGIVDAQHFATAVDEQTALLNYASGAARFDLGTPPILNAYAARAGMHLVAATGVERIRDQIERLSVLAYDLAPRLGLRIMGPKLGEGKGVTTAIDVGSQERAHRLEKELRDHALVVSARGRAIRLAPHGFTYEEEMEQALRTVARLMHEH